MIVQRNQALIQRLFMIQVQQRHVHLVVRMSESTMSGKTDNVK